MSTEKDEGKVREEYGKAEENIGKDLDDAEMKVRGKADKEYGKAEQKVGKEIEKQEEGD